MRWPWQRETRAQSFTDAVTTALVSVASGASGFESTLGVVEACASLWGRALASATVSPSTVTTEALTPDLLALIGRSLVLRGEVVLEMVVEGGSLELHPVSDFEITGPARGPWTYTLELPSPDGSATARSVTSERVLHLRWATDPERPWRGLGPLAGASTTVKAAGRLESALADELGAAVGLVLPVPRVDEQLQTDLGKLRGRLALVESTASGWGEGRLSAPRSDYRLQRLGSDPPATLETLRGSLGLSIMSACGIPPALLIGAEGAASQREAFREFLHLGVSPMARSLLPELRAKLATPELALSFAGLGAGDLTGRARALRSLVEAGVDLVEARRLTGLE